MGTRFLPKDRFFLAVLAGWRQKSTLNRNKGRELDKYFTPGPAGGESTSIWWTPDPDLKP